MGKKVFISHAAADSKMIKLIVEFLNSIGIKNDDIFCTSISGTLEDGKNFVTQIKENVEGSKIVIFILTERFFLSYFCLAELGAAWASNRNILPIIVPPISTVEYNNTPLIGIQALNMGNENFASEFNDNLLSKTVVERKLSEENSIFSNLNTKLKIEMNILRKDSKGFYMARLIESQSRQTKNKIAQPAWDQFFLGDRYTDKNETLWRLNGLLEIENDSSVTEHWIVVESVRFQTSTKLQFTIGDSIQKNGHQRLYSLVNFYELP